jgi:hypothetical protein
MNNINTNYAYKSGVLEGTIKSFKYRFSIPGIEITNHGLFEEFLDRELENARKMTADYSETNPN